MIYTWHLTDFGPLDNGHIIKMWRMDGHGRKIHKVEYFTTLEGMNRRLERFILTCVD